MAISDIMTKEHADSVGPNLHLLIYRLEKDEDERR